MPTSKLSRKIAKAVVDERVTNKEATAIVAAARAAPKFTVAAKAELSALLKRSTTKFEPGARDTLQQFLKVTPALNDLVDPKVMRGDASKVTWAPVIGGALAVDGITFDDVVQGAIGNCYLLASLSAIAQAAPEVIEQAIVDNHDGTYTVRFYERGAKPIFITVDADLPLTNGAPRYAQARNPKELWPSIIEKAFAQWKGGYSAIGNGGAATHALYALSGKPFYWGPVCGFGQLKRMIEEHQPVVAGTNGIGTTSQSVGLVANHGYSVVGASEANGVQYIELRNPWGKTEPSADGKDDGIFKVTFEDFEKGVSNMSLPVGPFR